MLTEPNSIIFAIGLMTALWYYVTLFADSEREWLNPDQRRMNSRGVSTTTPYTNDKAAIAESGEVILTIKES